MRKKWLINLSEEPGMINATLDTGRSLRQIIIGVSLFRAFQAIRMLLPVSTMVILASVKLSGDLMQEIHQLHLTPEQA